MRKILLVAATAAVLTVGLAAPATAATTGDTTTTFTLTGGDLAITVPGAADLGDYETGDAAVSGALGEVEVQDLRGSVAGWVASAESGAFTSTGNPDVLAAAVNYAVGAVAESGTVTVDASADGAIGGSSIAGEDASGNNTATWDPTISMPLDSAVLVGTYTGTITHSVL